jgi:hypothetical protein
MATQNQVNIGINVSDNGTAKKTVKNFEEITKAANTAQRAAGTINTPVGGTSGSRAVSAKAAPSGSQAMLSGEEYGRGRGSMGATGASARDFANQAQGLGGLVRLYATYAANIFAVSAAFNALSSAMDTSNMVKGLDQLGAASGVALGSLSKELVKATDGAISLRDAMTATAKASSSGMDSEQILRMGKVAQQASQTLGVDMADAISRISRGITKLEPELLDELGLFTKTGKAADDYAKSVGKSVTELTDFERRAAFANAVLAEGEAKFSQIKLDVNPYTKLLASIKDLAQVSLEFINKGLAPIVAYLSNSPTALGIAIASLGTVLVKQALPALGEFKAGLASAADRANQLSVQKAQDAGKARLAIDADILNKVEALADDKVAAVDAAERKIQAIESSGLNKRSAAYKLLQKDIMEVTQADIDAVEKRAKIAEKAGDSKTAAAYREVTSAVLEQKKAEDDLIITKQNLSKQLEKDANGMTTYGMTVRAAEKAQTAATNASIVSNAAYNGSLIGVRASMTLMRAEMQAAGIATNTFAGKLLLARGALAAVGGMASTVMAAFGPIMLVITAVSLAFSLLDGAMSKNNKQSADLSGSIDKLDANANHLAKTMTEINQKPFLERMSPESLKVKATALGEVSTAISSTINDLLKADKAASGWDKFIDGFKTLWSGDILSKTSKSLAEGITSSLANIAGSPEAKALNKELSAILKIDTETATFQQVQDSIKKLGQESPEKLKLVEEGFKKITLASQVSAAKGTELVDAFKKLGDIKQTIGNKFLPTDDLTKFGQELAVTSQKLAIALDDPQQKLNAIIQLSANAASIPGATFEQVSALSEAADLAKSIQVLEAKQLENKQKLVDKQEELSKLVGKDRAASIAAGKQTQLSGLTQEGVKQVTKLKEDLKELKTAGDVNIKVKTELTSKLEGYTKEIETATLGTYKAGADIVAKQISAEFIKAGKVVSDAYVSIIGETEATIKIKANSEKAVVNAQIQQILSQRDLTIATRELSLQMQKKVLEDQAGLSPLDRQAVQPKLAALELQFQAVDAAKTGDFSKLKLSTDVKDLKSLNVEANNFAQNMRASAAAVNNMQAQIKAIDISALDKVTIAKFEPEKKKLADNEKSVSLAKQELDIQSKLVTQGNMSYIAAKQALETKQLELQQETALLDNKVQIARLDKVISAKGIGKEEKDAAIAKKAELQVAEKTLKAQQTQQKSTLQSSQVQEVLAAQAFKAEEAKKREAENAELVLAKKSDELKIQESLFGMYSSIGLLSETQKVNQKFLLEQKSAELSYEQKIAQQKTSSQQQLDALTAREKAIRETLVGATEGTDDTVQREELDRIAAAKTVITTRTNEEAIAAAKVRDNTIGIANAIKTAGLEQERYNQLLENSSALAESLGNVFGDVGTKLGSLADSLTKIAISTEQGSKALEKIGKDAESAWNAGDIDKAIELESEYEKQKKKNTKTELDNNIKTVAGTKALFKEKTFAYKALDKIEKAMHLYKMAVFLKETAMDIWATGVSVANSTTRTGASIVEAGVDGVKAVVKAMSNLPTPWNFIAGAATAAVVGKLLGEIGGSGPSVSGGGTFTPTAEQVQETQGTGMSWDKQGNKVENGLGVFGDSSAKSESIVNSLEILRDNSVTGLSYDNRLLRAMEKLADSVTGAAETLYSIPGFRQSTMNTEGLGIGKTSEKGGVNSFLSDIPLIGGIVGGLWNSVFGGDTSVTKSIQGAGLELSGTITNLAKDTEGAITQYTKVLNQWHEDGGFLGSDNDWVTTSVTVENATTKARKAISEIFANAVDVFTAVGENAGMTSEFVKERLSSYDIGKIPIEIFDLQGQELLDALNAVIGQTLDGAAKSLFSQFDQYKKFGEGYLETVIRVTDANTKIDQLLKNFNSQTMDVSGVYFVTEALVKAAGGLDKFIDQANYFTDNFLTEAERLAPIQKAVTTQLASLGYASVDTKEEFVALVQSLDLTDGNARKTYQSLMELAPGFKTVTDATAAALKAREDSWVSFISKFGSAADKAAQNNIAIVSTFTKFNLQLPKTKAELFSLVQNLRVSAPEAADAVEGISDALATFYSAADSFENVTLSLSNSLKTTSDTLKAQIKTLKDYNSTLLLGSQSSLTDTQKYTVARDQIAQLQGIIEGPATTADEIKARNEAISSFTGAADTFLKLSSTLYASGPQYIQDTNLIRSAVTSTSSMLENQLSDAEKQLSELTKSNTFLLDISNAAKTTNELLQMYLSAGGTPISGSLPSFAVGTNNVPYDMIAQIHQGERIIPAADNAMLIQNTNNNSAHTQELVNQITVLTKQVEELAAAVAQGAILNAKATDRNTEEITRVINSSSDKTIQSTRLQAKAGIK